MWARISDIYGAFFAGRCRLFLLTLATSQPLYKRPKLVKQSFNLYYQPTNQQYKSLNMEPSTLCATAPSAQPARQETQVPSLVEHMDGEETSEVDERRSQQAA